MSESGDRQFALRMPRDLYTAIEGWAREDVRSMNQQIVFILREALAERLRKNAYADVRQKPIEDGGTLDDNTQTPGRAAELEFTPA